jgi:hypothetical protein
VLMGKDSRTDSVCDEANGEVGEVGDCGMIESLGGNTGGAAFSFSPVLTDWWLILMLLLRL